MENEDQQTISNPTKQRTDIDSSSAPSDNHRRDRRPPSPLEDSPVELSLSSYQSSPSHGFSPREEKLPASPPENPPENLPAESPSPVVMANRYVLDEPMTMKKEADPRVGDGFFGGPVEEGVGGGQGSGSGGRRKMPSLSILRRMKTEMAVKKASLGFRVFGFLFCLISFSVMSADKSQGWALDSYNRYKELRYCMSVNVIGFVYSGVQGLGLAYHLVTGKYVLRHQLRYYLDFAIDQMLSYLLISAASSAATRIDDWLSNWGQDKFPEMATASVGMSFLAFVAFAFSSLLSGYALCTFKST